MKLDWMKLWDELEYQIGAKNSWGKNELIDLMSALEKKAVRALEASREDR